MGKINRSHIISGLVGIALGSAGTFGGQAIFDNSNNTSKHIIEQKKEISNFDIIEYDENGDVYITRSGKKYHSVWCSHIKSKVTQRVNSSDAERAGLEPCKKCQ